MMPQAPQHLYHFSRDGGVQSKGQRQQVIRSSECTAATCGMPPSAHVVTGCVHATWCAASTPSLPRPAHRPVLTAHQDLCPRNTNHCTTCVKTSITSAKVAVSQAQSGQSALWAKWPDAIRPRSLIQGSPGRPVRSRARLHECNKSRHHQQQ